MTDSNKGEITALTLADDHAEEAAASLGLAKSTSADGMGALVAAMCAATDALLAIGARFDRLCEILNRELPVLSEIIADATQDATQDTD